MRLKFAGSLNGNTYTGMPVGGIVTSEFGVIRPKLSGQGKGHSGVDISKTGIEGTPILAPMDGVVNDRFTTEETVSWRQNVARIFGNCVMLRHNDSDGSLLGYTLYAHMAGAPSVERNQSVSRAQVLGEVGSTGQSTGPQLHWGCTVADNPYFSRSKGLNDPLNFLDNSEGAEVEDTTDEQQLKANDLIDAGQSMLNDLIDSLQGRVDDMEDDR